MNSVSAAASTPTLSKTAARAIAAYGGAERWLTADRIDAVITVTGLAWWLKMRRPVDRTNLRLDVQVPRARVDPVDRSGLIGLWDGKDVSLEDRSGRVVARRSDAGKYFPSGRRIFYWDTLDLAYFAGLAMWNYFTFPRLLLRPEIRWTEIADGILEAEFPADLPTHSRVQRFHFDRETGVLCRMDCTLEAVGPWARVIQIVDHYWEDAGVQHFGLRSVYFRGRNDSRIPWPKLIVGKVWESKLRAAP
jgi:hypothetical protein